MIRRLIVTPIITLFAALTAFGQLPAPLPAGGPVVVPGAAAAPKPGYQPKWVFSLLPKSLQKKPLLDFNVITEMTPAGRLVPPPSSGNPAYYVLQSSALVHTGSDPMTTKHVPPIAALADAMQKALAENGYVLAAPPEHAPSLAVIFTYGSSSINVPIPIEVITRNLPTPQTAEELLPIVLSDVRLEQDLLERAALVGGAEFARAFKKALSDEADNITFNYYSAPAHRPVNPELGSPYKSFLMSGNSSLLAHLVEDAFHSCYFVVASAYDFASIARGQRRLLWRTKMTVDAQGVNMSETLLPLVLTAAPYFGRDMKETEVLTKRISRDGNVTIGTATVVKDPPAPKEVIPQEPAKAP